MRHRISRRLAILGATIALTLGAPLGVVLAAHFNDVPNSNPFHADIQALANSGVTTGCGGGNFCPKGLVDREQMAAFMNRLGALGPGKVPVVNAKTAQDADKVDGLHASAFLQYGGTLPSGAQIRGAWVADGHAAAAGEQARGAFSFPVAVPSGLTRHIVPQGGPVPAGCSGNALNPGAAAGNLCIFVGNTSNAGAITTFGPLGSGAYGPTGAYVRTTSSGAGLFLAGGTWAARSPLGLASTLQYSDESYEDDQHRDE